MLPLGVFKSVRKEGLSLAAVWSPGVSTLTQSSEASLCVLDRVLGQQHTSVICLIGAWNSDFQKILKPPPFWTRENPWKMLPLWGLIYLLCGRILKSHPDREIFFRYCSFLKAIRWERFWLKKIKAYFKTSQFLGHLSGSVHWASNSWFRLESWSQDPGTSPTSDSEVSGEFAWGFSLAHLK